MRPLVIITVGYITGIIWGLYLNASIVPIFFLLILLCYIIKKDKLFKYKKIIAAFIIFAVISNIQILYLQNKYENLYTDEEEIKVIGTITSEKEELTYKDKYTVKVENVNGEDKYGGTYLIIYVNKNEELEYGDKVYFTGTFSFPYEATNYKAFDYREYLKTKKIYGTVIINESIQVLEQNNLSKILLIANKIRVNMKENLMEILGENSGLTIGMLLGDTSYLSDETIEEFKASNMYHILAVSGTHVRIPNNRYNFRLKPNKCLKKENKGFYGHIFDSGLCF